MSPFQGEEASSILVTRSETSYHMPTPISSGTIHSVPADLQASLSEQPDLLAAWNQLTPLARNEWICWLTIVKKETTRSKHLSQLAVEILSGQKRPCCWPGCPHHRPGAAKWFKHD